MYLKTPKRYTAKGSRRPLLNLRWLWLYLLVPILLIPLVLAWDYRDDLRITIDRWIVQHPLQVYKAPTPTATALPQDFGQQLTGAFSTGKINQALQLLNSLAERSPNDPTVYNLIAQHLIFRSYATNTDMLKEAVAAGQRAINAAPEIPDGWVSEALALDWSGQPQQALGYALRASELNPSDPMAMVIMAEIYSDLQKDDQASKLLDDAIAAAKAAKPMNRIALSHAYYVEAQLLSSTDGKAATHQLEEAWRVVTSDPPDFTIPAGYIAQLLASNYSNADQIDLATSLLGQAIKRDQDDPILDYAMAKVYYKVGDRNKARTYAVACQDRAPDEARCLRMVAQLFFLEQNYTQAAQSIEKVIAQGSKLADDYYLAGLSYSYLQQCDTAVTDLKAGLPFIQADDAKTRANYEDALRACNSTSGLPVTPTITDTPAPTAQATATPKKR